MTLNAGAHPVHAETSGVGVFCQPWQSLALWSPPPPPPPPLSRCLSTLTRPSSPHYNRYGPTAVHFQRVMAMRAYAAGSGQTALHTNTSKNACAYDTNAPALVSQAERHTVLCFSVAVVKASPAALS